MEEKQYYIKIKETQVEVSKELFLEYMKMHDEERNDYRRDEYHRLVSYNNLDIDDVLGIDTISDYQYQDIADLVHQKMQLEKLNLAFDSLSTKEKWMISQVFYHEKTEREIAKELNITQKAVNKQKQKILAKLKKMIEK